MNREEVIEKIKDHDATLYGNREYPGLVKHVNTLMEDRAFRKKMLWFCATGISGLLLKDIFWPIIITAAKAIK